MARKTHVIGYRLGEARWWETRTPPTRQEKESYRIVKKLIEGIMEKRGIILGEIQMEKGIEGEMKIKVIGVKEEKVEKKERKEEEGEEREEGRGAVEVYAVQYIEEIVKAYLKKKVKISYKEEEEVTRSARMMNKAIEKSEEGILESMRRLKRKIR